MEKPTKIQVTVDFEDIPKRSAGIVQEKVLREVAFVANVLQQVVGRVDPLPVEDLSFGIDQARRCLYNADLYLQDAQDMLGGFVAHKAQTAAAALEAAQAQVEVDDLLVKGPSEGNKDDESDAKKEPSASKK